MTTFKTDATKIRYRNSRAYYYCEDVDGKTFVIEAEGNWLALITARNEQDAWGCYVDLCPTIAPEDLPEAYGFHISQPGRYFDDKTGAPYLLISKHDEIGTLQDVDGWKGHRRVVGSYESREAAESACMEIAADNQLDIIEGYEHQGNSTDTGIVNTGHSQHISQFDRGLLDLEFAIIDHGRQHSDYFQGCGVCGTQFDNVATGVGNDAREALEDALEQIASNWDDIDTELLQIAILAEYPDFNDRSKVAASAVDSDSDALYHVSIRH